MRSSTFLDWVNKIESESTKFNINTNITVNDIDVYQNNPWYVTVDANVSMLVSDFGNIASWNFTKIIGTSVEVVGFEDPLYLMNTFGRMTNVINKTTFEGNYTYFSGGYWNVDNLINHVENSLYTENTDAPSFIMRFENNLSSSPYGIESCVNLLKMNEQNLEVDTYRSIVDHDYWAGTHNGDYKINNTPSWFRFDSDHISKYNLTGLAYIG
jgi:hypothetical protein